MRGWEVGEAEWNFSFLQRPKFKVCLLEFFKVDADRDKAVIFNVDICDYYFIISVFWNITLFRNFLSLKAQLCEELTEHRALNKENHAVDLLMVLMVLMVLVDVPNKEWR